MTSTMCGLILLVTLCGLSMVDTQNTAGYRLPTFQEFLVLAPKIVRPNMIYEVHVTLNRKYYSNMSVTALLSSDDNEYAHGSVGFTDVGTKTIQLKVPITVRNGTHKLIVEGLVQSNDIQALVTTNNSDVTSYASYLPIYHNVSHVVFSPKWVSLFIVLSRPGYKSPSQVLFRIVGVTPVLTPAIGSMTIYVRDSKGNFVRRWIQRLLNFGFYEGGFDIPYPANVGEWAIVVDAFGYRYEQPFDVRFWWQRSFEMNVTTPYFMYDSEWGIMGMLYGEHVSGQPAYGNGSITVKLATKGGEFFPQNITKELGYMYSTKSFHFSMDEMRGTFGVNPAGYDLYFLGTLSDFYYLETLTGTSLTHVYKDGIQLKVLGRNVRTFKPNIPFSFQVAVARSDGSMYDGFYDRQLIVSVSSEQSGGGQTTQIAEDKQIIPDDNILQYTVTPLTGDKMLRIVVTHPESGQAVEIRCYKYYSPGGGNYLALTSTTTNPTTQSYMTFQVRTTFYIDQVQYIIVSGGVILLGSQLVMNAKQKTFAVALSRQMAPSSHILAYCIYNGEVVMDTLTFFIRDTQLTMPYYYINYGKDFTHDTIELVGRGPPGSTVYSMAVDYEFMMRGALPFITEQKVIQELMSYDSLAYGPYFFTWWNYDWLWEWSVFFPASTPGMDTNTTVDMAGLIVLSDANITIRQDFTPCNRSLGLGICPSSYQCYELTRACDGVFDCQDGYDEIACPKDPGQIYHPRPSELSNLFWNSRYTDPWEMFWESTYIKQVGQGEIKIVQDELMDPIVFGVFFIHPDQGLSISTDWILHDTTRLFFVTIEGPDNIRRGEQIGLRLDIFNYWDQDLEVIITLHGDPSYKFIHVEDFGYVVSYAPRTSFGDFQTMLSIQGGQVCTYLMMPIVPTEASGDITVRISTQSSQRYDYEEYPLHIDYDCVVARVRHTPYLVDLVNHGSLIIPDLKVNISERFYDPGQRDLLYIPYSGVANLYVYGDMVSPGFFDPFLTTDDTNYAYHDSAEGYIYEFAINMQTLNYLQSVNLLNQSTINETLEYMNSILSRQYAYLQDDGSMKMFRRAREPCVRITSLVLKSLHQALVSTWAETLYIQVEILNQMARWLAAQQAPSGAFIETVPSDYDRSFWPNTTTPSGDVKTLYIATTAHVVITFSQTTRITGDAKQGADAAAKRAADYLSLHMKEITDPFQMAITAYALQSYHHKDKDTAYYLLMLMNTSADTMYWAAAPIPMNPTERINNVEFQYERQFHPNVGNAVMASSYGLLCVLAHNDLKNAVPIMNFITAQRNRLMGWSSTQDTLLALEALTAFANSETNRAFYNLRLHFECSSNATWSYTVDLNMANFADLYTFPILPAFGQLKTRAEGTGYAMLGLDTWYHLEKPYQVELQGPAYPTFDIYVESQRFWGRNMSHMEMVVCFKWLRTDLAPTSGMANVIVEIPTGFVISRDTIEWMYKAGFTALKRVQFYNSRLVTFFEYVGPNKTCFNFEADRWYPVANTSIAHLLLIQEYSETGLQKVSAYNAFTLFSRHICQVCGSFQCPYCAYYNSAPKLMTSSVWTFALLASLVSFLLTGYQHGGVK